MANWLLGHITHLVRDVVLVEYVCHVENQHVQSLRKQIGVRRAYQVPQVSVVDHLREYATIAAVVVVVALVRALGTTNETSFEFVERDAHLEEQLRVRSGTRT